MIAMKTDSYEDFYSACESAGLIADGEIVKTTHGYSMVLIGDLYKSTGETATNDDGDTIDVKEKLDGYHVNSNVSISGLEHLEIDVDHPLVKLSGLD